MGRKVVGEKAGGEELKQAIQAAARPETTMDVERAQPRGDEDVVGVIDDLGRFTNREIAA